MTYVPIDPDQYEFPLPLPTPAKYKSPFSMCADCETIHREEDPCDLLLVPYLFN